MPDFQAYVRRNLPPLGISGAREAEIVEELALDFQESYERALRADYEAVRAREAAGRTANESTVAAEATRAAG